jgi:hypothetical protein
VGVLADKIKDSFKIVGAFKMDLLVKDNIVYVIEVAPRLGGGKLSSKMIKMSYNISWWKAAIEIAMYGGITQAYIKQEPVYVAQRYKFPENPKSHKDRLGSVECEGKTYEEAILNAEKAITSL